MMEFFTWDWSSQLGWSMWGYSHQLMCWAILHYNITLQEVTIQILTDFLNPSRVTHCWQDKWSDMMIQFHLNSLDPPGVLIALHLSYRAIYGATTTQLYHIYGFMNIIKAKLRLVRWLYCNFISNPSNSIPGCGVKL